ncbi:hypothetical protein SU69_07340 [Thermosipho melanesiensis]|uniref:Fibronectin, type III domain protein n=2 Tax=Thermosipho melanesiensis TaxID=46541 RepID=A6LMZ2_THEM4|nr:fibronectin type III domain-containing protein [Thermosipho melanesiensis]ABR31293.1 Fibronectin, type III domain protein [Thermosipho melanesiensis BI429]APT74906.1 hypothetical protein BW47_07670 [Thermosipho melanesiensis]OOC36315.1 hypothetical protein SU68_07410 [Thermosipho melanesiensis]OOC37133.1 hypothetical protein SU69_07340 [Thermosipho melanesiensis]OOC37885.1 hypothetical protein SU70_07350 [Thermosipho melanesiensis]
MFPKLNVDSSYIPYIRHPTRYKSVAVFAKIDGTNWYDITEWVKEVRIVNKLEFLESPAIDSATIILANLSNEWTPTQYNDAFDPSSGKFNGTVDQAYLSKEWEVKILLRVYKSDTEYIDVPLFYGVKTQLTERHKEAEMKVADICYYATKKKLDTDILYIDMKPHEILADLFQRAGLDSSQFDFQEVQYPCTFLARKDSTIWQTVINLVRGTAGKISTTPEGKIIYRTRMDTSSYSDPNPALSLQQDTFKRYDLGTERRFNKITLESEGYRVDDDLSWVIDFELQGNNTIAPGTTATFELEYVSDYAVAVSDTIYISYSVGAGFQEDVPFTVLESTPQPSNEHIQITKYERYADKAVIEIKALTTSENVVINHVKIQGRQVKKVSVNKLIKENTTGEPDKEYSVRTFFDSQAVMSNIADVLYENINKTIRFGLAMNEFYADVYAGNLIEFAVPLKGISSGTFLVLKVEHSLQSAKFQTSLDIVEWKDIEFTTGDKTFTRATRSPDPVENQTQQQITEVQGQIQELQEQVNEVDERTNYIDSAAPSVPQNLSLSTTMNDKGESVVRVSFDPVPEADVIGYEVTWSLDGVHWHYYTTAETLSQFVVPGNTTVYVKVRALDAEGKKSDWSSAASITSAKDEVPPAVPTGLTPTGLFQTIMVKWNPNTEDDFDHYVLQYDTKSDFSTAKEIVLNATSAVIKDLAVNTTYYLRIKAVDKSGNASDWSSAVTASTVKLDDASYYDYAAIKDAIIQNGKIDTAWISELDAGVITTGYLDADRIQARSITLDKLAVSPAFSLPSGTLAYWTNSLIDEANQIMPEGYTEVNLAPRVTLIPENAPEGSVVGDLIAANTIYAGKRIDVGTGVNRWAIDGTNGLVRVLNNSDYPVLGIIYGPYSINMNGITEQTITLPVALTEYFVLLGISNFEYWRSTFAPNYSRKLILDWQKIDNQSFKILAYTQLVQPKQYPNAQVTVEYNDSTETYYTLYTITVAVDEAVVRINGPDLSVEYLHRYSGTPPYTIKVSYTWELKKILPDGIYFAKLGHIDWGDGTITEWALRDSPSSSSNVTATLVSYTPSTLKESANAMITYSVIGY